MYGRKFALVTDHKPLVWYQNSKDPCSRISRWRLKLAEYDFDVVYKAGKMNVNADALLRNSINDKKKCDQSIYKLMTTILYDFSRKTDVQENFHKK